MASVMLICNKHNKTHFCRYTCLHGRPHKEYLQCSKHDYCDANEDGNIPKCEPVKPYEVRGLIKEGRTF